jgi:hypothetical protein
LLLYCTVRSIYLSIVLTGAIKVFARMSPQGKASIIRSIQEVNKDFHVFMCGDGGNDVGALKQVCPIPPFLETFAIMRLVYVMPYWVRCLFMYILAFSSFPFDC